MSIYSKLDLDEALERLEGEDANAPVNRSVDTGGINTSGLSPVEYKILIQPESVEETDEVLKSARAAGIALPDKATDRERMAQVRGVLVAVGGNAFEGWQAPLPKVGDRIYYAKYSGIMVRGKDGTELRLANDKDISAIIQE